MFELILTHKCPECHLWIIPKINHREGIKYCPHCGTVLEATIDTVGDTKIILPQGLNLKL